MSFDRFLLSADTTDLNYPEIRPSLDLNFARTKTLDPRITFTRASGGSYVGADGLIKYAGVNEARFDHDPATGESLGLLIEENRANIWVNSNRWGQPIPVASPAININNGKLFTTTGVVYDAGIAPDGTNTAMQLGPENSTASMVGTNEPATICTFSTFVKRIGSTRSVTIRSHTSLNFNITFNFNSETFSFGFFPSYVTGSAGFNKYSNGWYRIWFTYNRSLQNNGNLWPVVEGSSSTQIFLWGAQKEAGNFPTSYIPTQSASRTRAADNASITGKNFSEWYRQDEGTLFCEAKGIDNVSEGNTRRYYEFNNQGSASFRLLSGYRSSTATRFLIVNNELPQADLFQTNQSPFKNNVKTASSFGNRYFRFYSNGLSATVDDFGTLPILDRLLIGSSGVSPQLVLNGTIKRFTYYPKRLPNPQLAALTL